MSLSQLSRWHNHSIMVMTTILDRQYPTQVIDSILSNHLRVAVEDGELYASAKMCVHNALGVAEAFTNRILVDSLVTFSLDDLDSTVIELPSAPVREIVEMRYRGEDNQWHTLSGYTFHGNAQRARLELHELPKLTSATALGRVEIDARCGFEDSETENTYSLPGSIEQAVVLLATSFWEGNAIDELPMAAQILLHPYRIHPYGL